MPRCSPKFSMNMLKRLCLGGCVTLHLVPALRFNSGEIIFHRRADNRAISRGMGSTCLTFPVSVGFDTRQFGGCHPCTVLNLDPAFSLDMGGTHPLLIGPFSYCVRINLKYSLCLPFFGLVPRLGFYFKLTGLLRGGHPSLASGSLVGFARSLSGMGSQVVMLAFCFRWIRREMMLDFARFCLF